MPVDRKALSKFEQFHGRKADSVGKVEIPMPKSLVFLALGVSIKYRAAKRNDPRTGGKMALYEHKLGKGVRIFTDPDGKALFIVGGKFKVTDWMRH